MIRVTLDVTTQDADGVHPQPGGVLDIQDDGTGSSHIVHYVWHLWDWSGDVSLDGRLMDVPRAYGGWIVVWRVLSQIHKTMADSGQEGKEGDMGNA